MHNAGGRLRELFRELDVALDQRAEARAGLVGEVGAWRARRAGKHVVDFEGMGGL
jgi:hypothetical protein